MDAPLIPPAGDPVSQSDRIAAIDVLRGFALCGILLMNIQSFAMIGMAYVNPYSFGDMTGANYWVWWFSHVFADQKFMTIFSMLFGAGIVLMTGRREAQSGSAARVHYRRMGVLLVFGLAHAYLLWFGDILVTYALAGCVAYLFRRSGPVKLIILGSLALCVHPAVNHLFSATFPHWPAEARTEFIRGMTPTPADIQKEIANLQGGWLHQMPFRAQTAIVMQTLMLGTFFFWRALGLMLFGILLFRSGFFSAAWSARRYLIVVVVGAVVGLTIILAGIRANDARNWEPIYLIFTGTDFNYWGSIPVSLAYCAGVMLICQVPALLKSARPLAAVGQMALTNYLMQSVICTTIFYGHGLGWFGQVERVGQLGIVVGVWVIELIWSPIWLHFFRFGPMEWLWRVLTYGRAAPFRRG